MNEAFKSHLKRFHWPCNSMAKTKNQCNLKMGKRPEQTFFLRHTDGQQVDEKRLNVTTHQGVQIKTTTRYYFTLLE